VAASAISWHRSGVDEDFTYKVFFRAPVAYAPATRNNLGGGSSMAASASACGSPDGA
jgi:hypothetical protein